MGPGEAGSDPRADEVERLSFDAKFLFAPNLSAGRNRHAGTISVTDSALRFTPTRFEQFTGARPFHVARSTVKGVTAADPTAEGVFARFLGQRLLIVSMEGDYQFVVNDLELERRVSQIQHLWDLPSIAD
jgi:hypothetical protein